HCRLCQRVEKGSVQGALAPQKHSAVPEIISRPHEFGRTSSVRFFGEALDTKSIAAKRRTSFDVSLPGLRAGGTDAQPHNILARRCDLNSVLQHGPVSYLVADYMIGRKQ